MTQSPGEDSAPRTMGTDDGNRIVVLTPEGMGVVESGDGGRNPSDLVGQPAKVMRVASWLKQRLDEVRSAPRAESASLVVHVHDDLPIPALRLTKPEKCSEQPDGEPPMKYGTNTRSMCSAWIRHMATTMKEDGESFASLGKRIICVANSRGYRMSQGGEFSTHLIDSATKPSAMGNKGKPGMTGGTKANPGAGRTKTGRK